MWYLLVKASLVASIIEDWVYSRQTYSLTVHRGKTKGCRVIEIKDFYYGAQLLDRYQIEQVKHVKQG